MSRNKSVMTHAQNQVPRANIPRSSFDLSHGYKTTFDAGFLVPFVTLECYPGDTINLRAHAFARLATPIKPVMDNMFMETFFFSVPVRQVWTNWPQFNGEQENPGDSTDFLVPTITTAAGITEGSVYDYMGIPPGIAGLTFNALLLRADAHIYRQWFRDQNLIDSPPLNVGDGPDAEGDYTLRRRRKRMDYFSGALPFPQKGDPVQIPLGGEADVKTNLPAAAGIFVREQNAIPVETRHVMFSDGTSGNITFQSASNGQTTLIADLTTATGVTINDLRQSVQIQKLLERDARGGTRFPEILKSHFGVTDPMMLVLQRPLFLGGGSTRININPVAQTTDTLETAAGDTPQGNLAGFGTASFSGHGFTHSFTEHSFVIGYVNVRADLTYQQGLERHWSRQTRFDFMWPAFVGLGEQALLNKEIFAQGTAGGTADDEVFGYQERFAELRYKPSLITGAFRSSAAAPLDVWHLSQDFATLPSLNESFIEDNPPIDRVIAVPAEPHFLFDSYINIRAARALPLYGTPGLLDHF